MSTVVLGQWPGWRDKLIFELRMKDVPGSAIGDILSEVASHVAETGEAPEEAFGDPVAYGRVRAQTVARPQHPYMGLGLKETVMYVASAVGGLMSAGSAWALGAGDPRWGPFPTWLAIVVGLVLLLVPLKIIGSDQVTDPKTGKAMFSESGIASWIATAFGLIAIALMGVAGWYVSR